MIDQKLLEIYKILKDPPGYSILEGLPNSLIQIEPCYVRLLEYQHNIGGRLQ